MRAIRAKAKKTKDRVKDKFKTWPHAGSSDLSKDSDLSSVTGAVGGSGSPPPVEPSPSTSKKPHKNLERAKGLLLDAVKLAKDSTDFFPGASLIFGGLEMVFDALDKVDLNASSIVELRERIESLAKAFTDANSGARSPGLIKDAKEMTTLLGNSLQDLKLMDSQGRWEHLIGRDLNESDLRSLSEAIASAVTLFQARSSIRQENQAYISELRGYLNKLPYVEKAGFQSAESDKRSQCFENTRVEVLKQIDEWVHNPDIDTPPIFWLNGMAGIGKSTIAQTVAERAYVRGVLGASFFFSRMDDKRRDPSVVLPTLAYQLALSSLAFEIPIGESIKDDPLVGSASLQNQLRTLIVNPLRHMDSERPVVLIVLDALDECERDGANKLLQLLVTHIPNIPFRFRILVTSRPEHHIASALEKATASANIILHKVEDSVVEGDISRYMQSTIRQIPSDLQLSLPDEWAKEDDIDKLVKRAGKLFIYAATSILFLRDDVILDPRAQLAILLQPDSRMDDMNPYGNLDGLYEQVLRNALFRPTDSSGAKSQIVPKRVLTRYKEIVGAIVLLREPLSMSALAQFVARDESDVRVALRFLQSVIVVPTATSEAPSIYHPSFPDYITSPSRCTDPDLQIDAAKQEPWLAIQCMKLLTTKLWRDMADIRDPSLMNKDVPGLRAKVNEVIPPEVRYACLFWASHLYEVESEHVTSELMDLLWTFLSRNLLWWLESLSLLENIAVAVSSLRRAHEWAIKVKCDAKITSLLYDGYRLILANSHIINDAALHVYHSALLFAPRETMLWETYQNEASGNSRIVLGASQNWSACLRVSHGHSDAVSSVSFSPDGRQLASGSEDYTVRLWDVATGTLTSTLEGHSNSVTSVVFSPDGRQLASGSEDETVRLWDVATGTLMSTLKGHSNSVTSVTFSPDGRQLASGSIDNMVRLWDVATGTSTTALEGHSDMVLSVTFSPDGGQLASGSYDDTVRLWNVATGTLTTALVGHSNRVTSVAFSPDGRRLASGSYDETVRLWDVATGALVSTLEGHFDWVTSVTFSPDGRQLASGSDDKTVRLWDVATGTLTSTLEGHSNWVTSAIFSPDGRQLASGSGDKTVRLWDVATGTSTTTFESHSGTVTSVTFSPDGRQLASGSYDKTVRLWDVATGTLATTLKGHSNWVTSVTFSPDGRQLASGSHDETVRLWDVATGTSTTTFEGHTNTVTSVTFSPDGRQLASGSYDETVRLWDVATGILTTALVGHSNWVMSVTFSPDGRQLVSSSYDDTVRLWDVATGALASTLEGHSDWVRSVTFSPDGRQLASGSDDHTVRLWDVATGALTSTLEGHSEWVASVAFSPSGSQVISRSRRGDTLVWELPSQNPINTSHGEAKDLRDSPGLGIVDQWLILIQSSGSQIRICHITDDYDIAPNTLQQRGSYVAVGCSGGQVMVLEVDSISGFIHSAPSARV